VRALVLPVLHATSQARAFALLNRAPALRQVVCRVDDPCRGARDSSSPWWNAEV